MRTNLLYKKVSIEFKDGNRYPAQGTVMDCDYYMITLYCETKTLFIPMANVHCICLKEDEIETKPQDKTTTVIDLMPKCDGSRFMGSNVQNPFTNVSLTVAIVKVYVDDQLIDEVDMPPGLDVKSWSNDIMTTILESEKVRGALYQKVQKDVHYSPGEVYITTKESPLQTSINSFSTTIGSPATEFLNPSQMVARLNKLGGKKKQ